MDHDLALRMLNKTTLPEAVLWINALAEAAISGDTEGAQALAAMYPKEKEEDDQQQELFT